MGRKSKVQPPPDWEKCEGISPFKLAEKRYKRYCGRPTDFSEVFDPWQEQERRRCARKEEEGKNGENSHRQFTDHAPATEHPEGAVSVPGHEGVLVLPGWLNPAQQLSLAHRCLASYPEPPNKTNLLPHMGQVRGIWEGGGKALEDLRWSTLGYQYDWTARSYPEDQRFDIPQEIQAIAQQALADSGCCDAIRAEACIVNYYTPSTSLGGHKDDVEPDQATPIVSVSLGCAAVFLAGGDSKQQPPAALWLRSGDVMIMSGAARRSMHGVPRILSPEEASSCPPLPPRQQRPVQGDKGSEEGLGEAMPKLDAVVADDGLAGLARACVLTCRGQREEEQEAQRIIASTSTSGKSSLRKIAAGTVRPLRLSLIECHTTEAAIRARSATPKALQLCEEVSSAVGCL